MGFFIFKKNTSQVPAWYMHNEAFWLFLFANFCITPRGPSHIRLSIVNNLQLFTFFFKRDSFQSKPRSYKSFIEKVIRHNQFLCFWALPLIPQTRHSTTETPWIPPDVLQVGKACLSRTLWAATSLMFVAHIWATQIIDWKGVHWSYQRFGKILHRLDSHLLFPISAIIII